MTDYEAAIENHSKAQAIYNVAVAAFRAGGSFEEFGAAQAAMKTANIAFDLAFEIECNRPIHTEPTPQGNQFVMPGCERDKSRGPKQMDLF